MVSPLAYSRLITTMLQVLRMQVPTEAKLRPSVLSRLNQLVSAAAANTDDEDLLGVEKSEDAEDLDLKAGKRKKDSKKGLHVLDQVR